MAPTLIPYCGPAPSPASLMSDWNFDLVALAAVFLTLAAGLYAARSLSAATRPNALAMIAATGMATAFISPLCALTTALFSARSLHHLVLICVAAPALALLLRHWRQPFGGGAALAGVSAVLWAWHVPAVYSAAWESPVIYWLLQIALLGTAIVFWMSVLSLKEGADRFRAALLVAALAGQMGLIGAILTFSQGALYLEHILLTDAFGLSVYADQHLAGLVMWVPGMAPLAALAALILRRGWREVAAA